MLFLGKADIQNSYVAFDGQSILLTRSVRIFFPSNAFMASARSFNMFESMLQLGVLREACAESTLNGEVTWRIICIVDVFHGSTKLGLEQESCQL